MDGNKKIEWMVCAGIIALAFSACKVQQPGYVGLYVDNLFSVTDTTDYGETSLNLVDAVIPHLVDMKSVIEAKLPDILHPAEEVSKISSDQHEVEKLLNAITDSVQLLSYQMIELQKQLAVMPDTSLMGEKLQESQSLNNQQTYYLTQQLLRAMDEQNQSLQNQLNAIQNTTARTPQQTYITREPAQAQPLISRQTDQLTLQMFKAQNDTIQSLRSQLRNLQLQPQKRDSVYIVKEAKELQPSKELATEQKATDLQVLQNTLQLLRTRVLSLEEQTLQARENPTLAVQDEKDVPVPAKTDSTLIVAFYKRGEIKPLEEASVLKQIKELCSNKNVTKITLSGFTDSSGSEVINKEITTRRLNYLSEMIIPWIEKEKIFFQNFGDNFASDTMVSNERRIEIRILTK